MSLLLKNCKALVQCSDAEIEFRKGSKMMELPILEDAYLFVKDAKIDSFGSMKELPSGLQADEEYDASGRYILPAYIDSHTHLVFPESREKEFVLKIKGASYEEIAASGGGILNSANKLAKASMDELLEKTLQRIDEVIKLGTAALEIKSGYGLSVEGELKMLKVIKRLKEVSPIPIKSTFLGAHAVPGKFKTIKRPILT
jgi:imidazolonepropionase